MISNPLYLYNLVLDLVGDSLHLTITIWKYVSAVCFVFLLHLFKCEWEYCEKNMSEVPGMDHPEGTNFPFLTREGFYTMTVDTEFFDG